MTGGSMRHSSSAMVNPNAPSRTVQRIMRALNAGQIEQFCERAKRLPPHVRAQLLGAMLRAYADPEGSREQSAGQRNTRRAPAGRFSSNRRAFCGAIRESWDGKIQTNIRALGDSATWEITTAYRQIRRYDFLSDATIIPINPGTTSTAEDASMWNIMKPPKA
jgi:hypothetical protein